MKKYKKILIILILIIIYMYTCNITMLPNNIILMQGEKLNLNAIFGINIVNIEAMEASSNLNNSIVEKTGKIDLELNLFNMFSLKDITVNVIPKTTVIPMGKAIGMKMYTNGVLVVGMSEIDGKKPYEKSGIEAGDKIIEIDSEHIDNTDELIECVNKSNGREINILVMIKKKQQVLNQ